MFNIQQHDLLSIIYIAINVRPVETAPWQHRNEIALEICGYTRECVGERLGNDILQMISNYYWTKGGLLFLLRSNYPYMKCKNPSMVGMVPALSNKKFIDVTFRWEPRSGNPIVSALDEYGNLYVANYDEYNYHIRPLKFTALAKLNNFRHIAESVSGNLILTQDGKAYAFRRDNKRKIVESLVQHHVVQINGHGSSSFQACITDAGLLFMWGVNEYYQCGVADKRVRNPTIVKLADTDGTKLLAAHISCGYSHCLLMTQCGLIMSWGSNAYGELGNGELLEREMTPKVIEALRSYRIVDIAAGFNRHSLCVDFDGNVWSWGDNSCGALGRSLELNDDKWFEETPKRIDYFVKRSIKARNCAAGSYISAVITYGNELYVFGSNDCCEFKAEVEPDDQGRYNVKIPKKVRVSMAISKKLARNQVQLATRGRVQVNKTAAISVQKIVFGRKDATAIIAQ